VKTKKRILNDEIKAKRVQLILDDGENLGEMSLNEAKLRAKEAKLDLMEIWKKDQISIVKMLDYGKYLYRQKKQIQKQKNASKSPDMKTLRITYKISDHDLEVKRKQAEKFAKVWHPLKVTLMLRWRENHYIDIALEKMNIFSEKIKDIYKQEWKINRTGSNFSAIFKVIK